MKSQTARPGWWRASDGNWYPPQAHPNWEARRAALSIAAPSVTFSHHLRLASTGEPLHRSASEIHRSRWVATIVLLCMALVADGLLLLLSGGSSPWASSWNPRVLGIVQFVEAHTGLTFRHPVKVQFLSNAAFDAAVTETPSATDRKDLNQAVGGLRALGLISGPVDISQALNTLNTAQVVGEYRDDTKTVYVRGTTLTPYVRVTLAHELTHAAQDQYFDLSHLQNPPADVDSSAVTALVEGAAVRVEDLYLASLTPHDQALYNQENQALDAQASGVGAVPEILDDLSSFPYVFGPTYVDALYENGGYSAIDAAFRHPPTTQAQILDPASYPLVFSAADVGPPPIPRGTHRLEPPTPFGQIMLFEVLGSRLGYDGAWNAVQGWEGDNSVLYEQGGRTCTAVTVQMHSTAELATLQSGFQQWARDIPGATLSTSGRRLTVRSCDPGSAQAAPAAITPSAFSVLSARSEIIDTVITQGRAPFALGRCVADTVLSSLGPAKYSEVTGADLSASQLGGLQQLAARAAVQCGGQAR